MKVRKKKLIKIYLALVVVIIIIVFVILENLNLFSKYKELDVRNDKIISKIENEEEKREKTEEDLFFLKTEEGQERLLIEKKNFKRPGEKVIKILDF